MGLTSSLHLARTGLLAQQTALETTGNNLANIATEGYKRKRVELGAVGDRRIANGNFQGQGVQIQAITRQVSEAVESRLRTAISDQSGAAATADQMSRLEAVQGELSGNDLTTRLGEFFNAWSQLTTNPQDPSLRTLVTSEGASLSSFINDLRSGYNDVRAETTTSLRESADTANQLLGRIESVNSAIATQEGGVGEASSLRDQRDKLLAELAMYVDVSSVEQNNGSVDVFVGSIPVILNGQSRGIEIRTKTVDGVDITQVVTSDDGTALDISKGELGARIQFVNGALGEAITQLDNITGQLIHQTNRIHSQGQGTSLIDAVTATNKVADTAAALNDEELTGLPFLPTNGSFELSLVSKASGQKTTATVNIDLDGIDPTNDTSLDDMVTQLNAIAGVTASVSTTGQLVIRSDSVNNQISFSNDTSGVLAALGVNSFFTGKNAFDIDVNSMVANDPALLAAARENLAGDNRNALALSELRDVALAQLGGLSITRAWSKEVESVGQQLAKADNDRQAFSVVRENLEGRQAAVSGVNADEETINLLSYQRAYQASARFISVVDEMTQTLLNMV